jgi:hypothetical protein
MKRKPPFRGFASRPTLLDFARPPALWGSGGASLTGFSRATHAWHRLSATAGSPAHDVTAVPTVVAETRRACRSLGGHGPAAIAMTAVIAGIRSLRDRRAGRDRRDSAGNAGNEQRHLQVGQLLLPGPVQPGRSCAYPTALVPPNQRL